MQAIYINPTGFSSVPPSGPAIPVIATVTSAFEEGELGWWNDVMYESLISVNVYTPEQYPAGWKIKE